MVTAYIHYDILLVTRSSGHAHLVSSPSRGKHMPNLLLLVSTHRLIISRYRGSKMCSGQGRPGNARVHTKMGSSTESLRPTLRKGEVGGREEERGREGGREGEK